MGQLPSNHPFKWKPVPYSPLCSDAGSVVYRQASEGTEVYVLRSGFVRLLRELHVQVGLGTHSTFFPLIVHCERACL